MLLIQKKDHYLRQGWRAFSQSVAKAPPVVTNLQQNCGMKKKKKNPNCIDFRLVQVTERKLFCQSLVDARKKANIFNCTGLQRQLQGLLAQEFMFKIAESE